MLKKVLALVLLLAPVAFAQEPLSVSQHFKPKDALHYYVRFDGDPELDRVGLQFRLITPKRPDQLSLSDAFDVSLSSTKVSPGVYEVNGVVSDSAASGTYELRLAFAVHDRLSHNYSYPQEFSSKIDIEVVNDSKYEFPKIKSITPNKP